LNGESSSFISTFLHDSTKNIKLKSVSTTIPQKLAFHLQCALESEFLSDENIEVNPNLPPIPMKNGVLMDSFCKQEMGHFYHLLISVKGKKQNIYPQVPYLEALSRQQ